uniref:Uncharacterized 11.6 kDa protein n=1 Tax=Claviceps purpurea TaxID=5111 RepID=YPC4_CLAPU|nr:RecName: Full=Uncharacterized 11.6 kDa protein; AltName: Full=ORF4 [Claviceps purpurea]
YLFLFRFIGVDTLRRSKPPIRLNTLIPVAKVFGANFSFASLRLEILIFSGLTGWNSKSKASHVYSSSVGYSSNSIASLSIIVSNTSSRNGSWISTNRTPICLSPIV